MSFKLQRRDSQSDNEKNEKQPENKHQPNDGAKPKYSVTMYVTILFAAVLVVILLSYFIQLRNNSETISTITQQHKEFSSQALDNIEELQNKNMQLAEDNEKNVEEISSLNDQIDSLTEENSAKTEENESLQRENSAIKALMDLQIAIDKGDTATAKNLVSKLNKEKSNLSAEYQAKFQELQQILNKEAE